MPAAGAAVRTEPVIRVMGEGDDRERVEEAVEMIVTAAGHTAAA